MGFPRQEHWKGLPFLSPGDLPDPGIKPVSHALQADSFITEPPGKLTLYMHTKKKNAVDKLWDIVKSPVTCTLIILSNETSPPHTLSQYCCHVN